MNLTVLYGELVEATNRLEMRYWNIVKSFMKDFSVSENWEELAKETVIWRATPRELQH